MEERFQIIESRLDAILARQNVLEVARSTIVFMFHTTNRTASVVKAHIFLLCILPSLTNSVCALVDSYSERDSPPPHGIAGEIERYREVKSVSVSVATSGRLL